ncbi:MAG: hypothetical protein ABSF99_03825 [Anaerolineales bacterium]
MEHTPQQIRAFRYWIQGYQNFYEPIVEEYFKFVGYHVLAHPAQVTKADIERVRSALFDGRRKVGPGFDAKKIIRSLEKRTRLQPDFLLEKGRQYFLAELKSWGGFTASGTFDLAVLQTEFINEPDASAFFLIDLLDTRSISGKILVVSSRSREHEQVLATLRETYQTPVELLYLDEIYRTPQLAGFIDKQLRYLDAAVAEIKQALGGNK